MQLGKPFVTVPDARPGIESVKHTLNAAERLTTRRVRVQLGWVLGYRRVEGNGFAEHGTREMAPI
jgi:hypothetical protein